MSELIKGYLDAADTTFSEQGSGVPVVLVHGTLCDHRIWEAQRGNIAPLYRYIAPNLRYHGIEPWPDGGQNYSAASHEEQVAAFIEALAIGPVHLVGQSYGAYIALRIALQYPERVRSLALQEPSIPSLVFGPDAVAAREERQKGFSPAATAVREGRLEDATRLLIEVLINKGPGTWAEVPVHLKDMFRENARTLPLFFLAPPPPPITCAQLSQLRVPTLVINGAETMRFFATVGETVAKCIPDCRRVVIQNATHGIETQNPTAYGEVLLDFLGRHSVSINK